MPKYDAVLFDLDGTLLDTLNDLAAAVNYALAHMDWPARSRDEVKAFVGDGVKLLIDRASPAGTSPEGRARCLDLFRSYYAAHASVFTAPYPGIPELLADLKRQGLKTAVCSNKFDAAVKDLAGYYFPGLLTAAAGEAEEAGIPKKPHPAMVDKLLVELEVPRERTLYVGDSDTDLRTAENAHLDCVAVTWGFRDRAFLLENGAKVLIDRPEELLRLIQ